jgi:hypothetical protein
MFFKALASGVLISGIASQMVSAAVIFDLRATGKNALPLSGGDTAKAISALAGDQIELTLFVKVTGVLPELKAIRAHWERPLLLIRVAVVEIKVLQFSLGILQAAQ